MRPESSSVQLSAMMRPGKWFALFFEKMLVRRASKRTRHTSCYSHISRSQAERSSGSHFVHPQDFTRFGTLWRVLCPKMHFQFTPHRHRQRVPKPRRASASRWGRPHRATRQMGSRRPPLLLRQLHARAEDHERFASDRRGGEPHPSNSPPPKLKPLTHTEKRNHTTPQGDGVLLRERRDVLGDRSPIGAFWAGQTRSCLCSQMNSGECCGIWFRGSSL